MDSPRPPKRPGRRPHGSDARERIITEARRLFAQQGFKDTPLRQIAEAADVDVALISHYFGGKQALFDTLTQLPFDPQAVVAELTAPGLDGLGERLVLFLLRTIREHLEQQGLIALLRSSGGHTEISQAVKRHYVEELLEPLARDLHTDQPELRAALCSAHLLGLSFAEQVLELDGLTRTPSAELARIVGATLQRYLVGEL